MESFEEFMADFAARYKEERPGFSSVGIIDPAEYQKMQRSVETIIRVFKEYPDVVFKLTPPANPFDRCFRLVADANELIMLSDAEFREISETLPVGSVFSFLPTNDGAIRIRVIYENVLRVLQ